MRALLLLVIPGAGLVLTKVPVREEYMNHHLGPQPHGGKLLGGTAEEDCRANWNPPPPRLPCPENPVLQSVAL